MPILINKLLDIADKNQKLIELLYGAKQKLDNIDRADFVAKYNSYTTNEGQYNFLKRNFRTAFKELYTELHKLSSNDTNGILFSLALCCYNQDWDYIFDALDGNLESNALSNMLNADGKKISLKDIVDVKSWGHIYQDYNVNLLKQIRNGFAHSKFDYDEQSKIFTINIYKGTFLTDIPFYTMVMLPAILHNVEEYSSSSKASTKLLYFSVIPEEIYAIDIKNDNVSASDKKPNKLTMHFSPDEIKIASEIKKEFDSKTYSFEGKIGSIKKYFSFANKMILTPKELEKLLDLFEYFGMSVENTSTLNAYDILCKNNIFKMALFDSSINYQIADENFNLKMNVLKSINSLINLPNQNLSSYYTLTLLLAYNAKNENQFMLNTFQGLMPFALDEMTDFALQSYCNYVFNFLASKTDVADQCKTTDISTYFTKYFIENNPNNDKKLSDILSYIRNCVVHNGRIAKNGKTYYFRDNNKDGSVSFEGEIEEDKLIDLAKLLTDYMKTKQNNLDSNVSQLSQN